MSDLTITLAGESVDKKTGGEVLQVNKKLTQMKVDSFDITATLTADGTAGDVMFVTTEIPNAVSVTGGRALLHSAVVVLTNNATDASGTGSNVTGDFNLIFKKNDISKLKNEKKIEIITFKNSKFKKLRFWAAKIWKIEILSFKNLKI